MLLTSILLLFLTILISWFSHHALMMQFDRTREDLYQRQIQDVHSSLQRSSDAMREMASLVASSEQLSSALYQDDGDNVRVALMALWPTLQLDAGLDDITVYNRQLHSVVTMGQSSAGSGLPSPREWLSLVINREEPADQLFCQENCWQSVAVPVLSHGEDVGVISVSRTLADVTRYLQRSASSEIVLLVDTPTALEKAPVLAPWDLSLAAMTHASTQLPFMRQLSQDHAFSETLGKSLQYAVGGQAYVISSIPISHGQSGEGADGYFLLVSDVTAQLQEIDRATHAIFWISLSGWLIAEIVLYLILRHRMGLLQEISRRLPLLATRRYDVMRYRRKSESAFFYDEIDVLENTAVELELQLESMEREISTRGVELERRVNELARERDFIKGMMNTAQVLVVSHRPDGQMTLVNRLCCELTGLDESRLRQSSFQSVFSVDFLSIDDFWMSGGQQEGVFVSADGFKKTIVWYHTPLVHAENGQEMISVGVDITERKAAENRLSWLANRDPLTELYNRRFFEEALQRAVVPGSSGAVLYLDLDRFKDVNELSGHQSGDRLLRAVASSLADLNQGCIVARLGGDEFAVLLEYGTADDALNRARDIASALDQRSLHIDGRVHRASASIGIALYPDNGERPDELMANADYAMYRAKEDASQRWYLLLPDQQGLEDLKLRVYWAEKIRHALLYGQFRLMVQPIFRLSDLEIKHYEALLRLEDENGSYLSPGDFIPFAERGGQIIAIDRWVVSAGIEMLSCLADTSIGLAINLSGQSLHDQGLTAFIRSELDLRQLEPRRLIIEVTETAAVTDFTTARGVLEDIRKLGCQVALDDFGVGFSSFHYLGQLPSDYIKIDGSFITTLAVSEESRLIVKAIADIARGLGKKTVAEFVDKGELMPYLKDYNIDYVQGYHLGKPMRVEAIGLGRDGSEGQPVG